MHAEKRKDRRTARQPGSQSVRQTTKHKRTNEHMHAHTEINKFALTDGCDRTRTSGKFSEVLHSSSVQTPSNTSQESGPMFSARNKTHDYQKLRAKHSSGTIRAPRNTAMQILPVNNQRAHDRAPSCYEVTHHAHSLQLVYRRASYTLLPVDQEKGM